MLCDLSNYVISNDLESQRSQHRSTSNNSKVYTVQLHTYLLTYLYEHALRNDVI